MMGSGGESDSSEEIHYGPGFVSRLKSRYMSVALRGSARGSLGTLRRTASLEDFLEIDKNRDLGHLGYAGHYAGHYGGYGLGYYGKREAEPKADADPYLLYGGYYGHGLGYGYSGLGYHGLGYRVYGKRSASAER